MRPRLRLLASLFCILLAPVAARAAWPLDGTPVTSVSGGSYHEVTVPDGAGGAVVAWQDSRNGVDWDIYAQRVDASGTVQWSTSGVALCTATGDQYYPTIVSDGAGGAIVAWVDYRSGTDYDIYAQRIDASGVVQWTANGVAVCTAAGNQGDATGQNLDIVADGAGGAIVTWADERNGITYDIYAQKIDATGTVQWTSDGVSLYLGSSYGAQYPSIVSDGSGGAVVAWQDFRNGANFDVYAQRVGALGAVQWAANGVALCRAFKDQITPASVSDGSGGAIVAWQDQRSGYHIYAQRINGSGIVQWTTDGLAVCTAPNSQFDPAITSDGADGAIVAWTDFRSGTNYDIYAQRVTTVGTLLWAVDGVAVSTAVGQQSGPVIGPDGAGGSIVAWADSRNGTDYDIYAQRISTSGDTQWTANGVPLCTASNTQNTPALATDGTGGAIVAWVDYRGGQNVYAQRVDGNGYWGQPAPTLTSVADVAGDQGGHVMVSWNASSHDIAPLEDISHYTLWRQLGAAAAGALASSAGDGAFVDPASIGPGFQGKAYRRVTTAAGSTTWEFIATIPSRYATGYGFDATTLEDSTSAGPADETFQVLAHGTNAYIFYESNIVTGHSVDNLSPAAPLYLMASRNGADVDLHWNAVSAPDLKDYTLYRATASGVTPIASNFLTNATDTAYVDAGAPTTVLYYIVTATDVHDNQSTASNEASVSGATGVGHTPALTALAVQPNVPNPFNASTDLEIGLPAAAPVEITVYDVAGRRVRTMHVAGVAGWQAVPFSGRDARGRALASGVYFYRVNWDGTTETRKMVIER